MSGYPPQGEQGLKTYQGHVVAQSSVCLVVRASWSLKTPCCQTRGERCCCFAPAPSLRVPIIAGGRIATETPYSLVQVGPAFVIFCYLSEPAQHLLRSHAGYPGGAPGGQGGYGQGPPQVRAYCRVRSFACWSPVRWPCMPLMCKVVCGVLPSFHCSLCPYLRGCMHLQGYGYQQGPPQGAYPQQVVPHVLHHACHRCMPTAMRQPIEGIALCHHLLARTLMILVQRLLQDIHRTYLATRDHDISPARCLMYASHIVRQKGGSANLPAIALMLCCTPRVAV